MFLLNMCRPSESENEVLCVAMRNFSKKDVEFGSELKRRRRYRAKRANAMARVPLSSLLPGLEGRGGVGT